MAEEKKEATQKTKRPTAKKRDLQSERKRLHNRAFRAKVLTAIRSLEQSLNQKEAAPAKDKLNLIYSLVDKGVKTGIYKLNKASRIKSRLSARTQAIS